MNTLIVEPDRQEQQELELIFREYSTNIFLCDSGEEAINTYQVVSIDLICVAGWLPDMLGVELAKRIRQLKYGQTQPILMVSSEKNQELVALGLEIGITEFFTRDRLDDLKTYLQLYAEHARQQRNISGVILLIDMDLGQSGLIMEYFRNASLRFVHFTSAEEAAGIAHMAEFDLVITSVVLGGSMSGIELIREIRQINENMYRVPILAVSSLTTPSQKIELLRAGANDFIQKPIVMEELAARVYNLLQNKKLFDTVEQQKKQLQEMAVRDQLTGLYNRHHLASIAEKTISAARRHNFPISLMVIDLDFFKQVNDTYGHGFGDTVLQEVANLLRRVFRGSDTPVRFGGEEFVVLLSHCNGRNALIKAESLRKRLEDLQPLSIKLTASIGVSVVEGGVADYRELFDTADSAVYIAKKQGRNQVVFKEVKRDGENRESTNV